MVLVVFFSIKNSGLTRLVETSEEIEKSRSTWRAVQLFWRILFDSIFCSYQVFVLFCVPGGSFSHSFTRIFALSPSGRFGWFRYRGHLSSFFFTLHEFPSFTSLILSRIFLLLLCFSRWFLLLSFVRFLFFLFIRVLFSVASRLRLSSSSSLHYNGDHQRQQQRSNSL